MSITYTATIKNQGPGQAQGIAYAATVAGSLIVQSVTTSQGTCGSGNAFACNLGTLASGSSAMVTITAIPTTSGTVESTATGSSVSFDSTQANNQATSSTTVSGALYSAVPVLANIEPAIVQAGSGSFMLTVIGRGFNASSVIQLNGTALSTTFISGARLTANVDSSAIKNYGWAAITVSNPSPGGGTSQIQPLTIYDVVNVPANAIAFDPFTRKLYATLPSGATNLTGNSTVAVDPVTGSVGTPVSVGSEPNVMAETSDGNYMFVGLSGANSLGRFNLLTQQLEAAIPMSIASTQVAALSIATMPGSDTTLAVDTGSLTGIAIFDIAGNTGTFRSQVTGVDNGDDPVFADAAHLYAYDPETSGANFYRYSVDASGAVPIDGTVLNGFGGASGSFKLDNGTVYGAAGGIVNPNTTPPSQIATLGISTLASFGLGPSAVAPDTATGKVFLGPANLTGPIANPPGQILLSLVRYNTTQFVAESSLNLQIPGAAGQVNASQVNDMLRWGQDGLALRVTNNTNSNGVSQIYLIRGPFVLPSELDANPAPTLTGASQTTIPVNSGNTTLTVTGSGFLPGAIVLWNGSARSTTFVDAGHLSVAVAAADVTSAASVGLTAQNPGSTASGALTITVQ